MSNSMHRHNTLSKLLKLAARVDVGIGALHIQCMRYIDDRKFGVPFQIFQCFTAPSLNEIILNAALALQFYVCGHGLLFQSCSTGNPQYSPEVWHQTPGTSYILQKVT
jgi:hypothetical protein